MGRKISGEPIISDSRSYLWLVLVALLGPFTSGEWVIPFAAWLGPIFTIRFLRTQPLLRGFVLCWIVVFGVISISQKGLVPIPGAGFYVFALVTAMVFLLPYLADRVLVARKPGFLSTLIFPCAMTSLEYLNSFGPYGSWGSIAYSQYANLPFIQLCSVTGLWGLTFLMSWFAAVVNWVWQQDFDWNKSRIGVGIYGAILVLVLLFGGARLVFFSPRCDTIRVASLTRSQLIQGQNLFEKDRDEIRKLCESNFSELLTACTREARAGAKILFWAEANAAVPEEDESIYIEMGKTLARQEGVYLGMALGIIPPDPTEPYENKIVFVGPSGEILWEYLKAHPVPGERCVRGDGNIHVSETPYGGISCVICFDTDFPGYIRQAGRAGVDLLFAPSNDWEEIMGPHLTVASYRAIENGFTLVRPTSNGYSAVVDNRGRILSKMDSLRTENGIMVSHVPVKGTRTIYSQIGDVFAWFSVIGLILLAINAVLRPAPTEAS